MPDESPWTPDDTFGARLALIRQRMGWNMTEAAQACGTTDQSWRNWETGEAKPRAMDDAVAAIAKATGCNPVWLMFGNEAVAS